MVTQTWKRQQQRRQRFLFHLSSIHLMSVKGWKAARATTSVPDIEPQLIVFKAHCLQVMTCTLLLLLLLLLLFIYLFYFNQSAKKGLKTLYKGSHGIQIIFSLLTKCSSCIVLLRMFQYSVLKNKNIEYCNIEYWNGMENEDPFRIIGNSWRGGLHLYLWLHAPPPFSSFLLLFFLLCIRGLFSGNGFCRIQREGRGCRVEEGVPGGGSWGVGLEGTNVWSPVWLRQLHYRGNKAAECSGRTDGRTVTEGFRVDRKLCLTAGAWKAKTWRSLVSRLCCCRVQILPTRFSVIKVD